MGFKVPVMGFKGTVESLWRDDAPSTSITTANRPPSGPSRSASGSTASRLDTSGIEVMEHNPTEKIEVEEQCLRNGRRNPLPDTLRMRSALVGG